MSMGVLKTLEIVPRIQFGVQNSTLSSDFKFYSQNNEINSNFPENSLKIFFFEVQKINIQKKLRFLNANWVIFFYFFKFLLQFCKKITKNEIILLFCFIFSKILTFCFVFPVLNAKIRKNKKLPLKKILVRHLLAHMTRAKFFYQNCNKTNQRKNQLIIYTAIKNIKISDKKNT